MKQYLLRLVLLLACTPVPLAYADILNLNLPDIGDTSGSVISPQEERHLGEAFMREVRRHVTILDDPEVNEYIQSLGYRLAANSDNQTQDFTFFIVKESSVNAFAAPGGFIGVHSGLILATESESELASVIAHEIGHITQRHLARAVEQSDRLNLPATAALIAAIVLGGQAGAAVVQGIAVQKQINFTRGNEQEADRVGMQTLVRAEFDPRSMPTFFERLQQSTRFSSRPPEFLLTHPVTEARIADARNRAEQLPYRQVKDSLTFQLMRVKLQVLEEPNPKVSVKRFAETLKSGQFRSAEAQHYGYALALLASGDYQTARSEANTLLANNKDQLTYQLLLAQIDLASGQQQIAMTTFTKALELYPGNNPLTMLYASALLQTGQANKARSVLEKHVKTRTSDPALYKLLAQAEGDAGFKASAHQAQAEYYFLNGQTEDAIQQLTFALKTKQADFYQASQIEARLKELQDELALETKP